MEAIAVHNATASQSTAASAAEEGGAPDASHPSSPHLACKCSSQRDVPLVPTGAPDASLAFSARDLREIAQLHANYQGRLFELLAASFCPTIFGHEVVKVIATDDLLPGHIWA